MSRDRSGNNGGGSGGSSGGGGGGGGYSFKNGRFEGAARPEDEVREKLGKALSNSATRNYWIQHLTSPLVQRAYEKLGNLGIARVNRSWEGELDVEVAKEPGCFRAWVMTVVADAPEDTPPSVRTLTLSSLEDFLFNALGEDGMDLYFEAAGDDALAKLSGQFFDRRANNFLTSLLSILLERESVGMEPDEAVQLRAIAKALANRMVAAFERKFRRESQTKVSYGKLFQMFQKNVDWTLKVLRSEIQNKSTPAGEMQSSRASDGK